MASTVMRALERRLEEIPHLPRPRVVETVPTGISGLDDLLPGRGLPRGRAVEWLGPRSCGKTAVLRSTLARLQAGGEPVAVVDPGHTLYAPDWAELAGPAPFWVVRPERPEEAAWCADLLLRSGAFGAVALETAAALPPGAFGGARRKRRRPRSRPGLVLSRTVAVRLQRLAEEAGSLFVVVGELPLSAVRLRFRPGRLEPLGGPPADGSPLGPPADGSPFGPPADSSPLGPPLPPLRPVWATVGKRGEREVPILCPAPPERAIRPAARDRKGRR